MATWGELSKFKWNETEKMNLTWEDIHKMSFDQLMELAQMRLDQFQPQNSKEELLKSTFQTLLVKIASQVMLDIAKEIDWLDVLRSIVHFFNKDS